MPNRKPGFMKREQTDTVERFLQDYSSATKSANSVTDAEEHHREAAILSRWRFGIALLILGCFIMLLYLALPNDSRRSSFFGFSLLTIAVAAWTLDRANRRLLNFRRQGRAE